MSRSLSLTAAVHLLPAAFIATVATVLLLIVPRAMAQSGSSIITFDGPGAGTGKYQGTSVAGMNSKGTIVGNVTDSSNNFYGFLRRADGSMSKIKVPGASFTLAEGINDAGTIVGEFYASGYPQDYLFLRTPEGKYTFFLPPYTQFLEGYASIDNLGNVAGTILSTYDFFACYIRTADGTATIFGGFDCEVDGIVDGTASGFDSTRGGYAAFLRNPDGTLTLFLANAAVQSTHVNAQGAAAGSAYLYGSGSYFGFVRATDASITDFTLPGSVAISVNSFNNPGALAGACLTDFNSGSHGYQRLTDGTLEIFDAPGAGTAQFLGTFPAAINDAGSIAGTVIDSGNVSHGFLRTP